VLEFVRLRKNEWRSSAFFELAQKTITVTILTKLAVIYAALLLEHLLFDRAQKFASRLIQQLGFAPFTFVAATFTPLQ
jgi:hypothetical protein